MILELHAALFLSESKDLEKCVMLPIWEILELSLVLMAMRKELVLIINLPLKAKYKELSIIVDI